ncbi:MAG: rod shape-determining protein MreC [Marinifilaceae bacterium]
MKEIVKLIIKYQFTIVFIILEIIACSLIIRHNHYQRTFFSNHSHFLFNSISSQVASVNDYFGLKDANLKLLEENTKLRNELATLEIHKEHGTNVLDSVYSSPYIYRWVRAINVSANRTKNYITINAGQDDNVHEEMAVLSKEGVVGIVHNTGENYSTILPLINVNLKLSAKLKKNDYFGSLQWDGNNYRYSHLNDIPYHVQVSEGDTVVTSGYSYIFPEGELIGFVEEVSKENPNFLTIKVRLAVDFKNIRDLYVVENKEKELITQIEKKSNE